MKTALLFLVFAAVGAFAAYAQVPPSELVATCPVATAAFTPACALPGGTCPSLAECNNGWLWMAPHHPVKIAPISFQRNTDGSVGLVHCYLDPLAQYAQGKPPCPLGSPPSISLRDFCARVKGFATPPPIPGVTNQPAPSFAGICGASLDIPAGIRDTLAAAPGWVQGRPRQAARLRQLEAWLMAAVR